MSIRSWMYQKIQQKRHHIDEDIANQTHWDGGKKHMEQMLEEAPESILRNLDMGNMNAAIVLPGIRV